jgi:hypothetical protein
MKAKAAAPASASAEAPLSPQSMQRALNICRFHRQHERYHSGEGLRIATQLRKNSNALKILADRWSQTQVISPDKDYVDPLYQAVGCEDLNDPAGITATGILFMEGESEPREINLIRAELEELTNYYQRTGDWLLDKMDAGWARESVLLHPEFVDIAYHRHAALINTTLSAQTYQTVARILKAAHQTLCSLSFQPNHVRAGLPQATGMVRLIAWLMDDASALLGQRAAQSGLVDGHWTRVIEGLARRVNGAPPGASASARPTGE